MTNLRYLLIALGILIVVAVIDAVSHQKFNRKGSIIFHVLGILILLVSMFALIFQVFKFTFFVYPGILIVIIGLIISYKGLVEIKPNLLKAGEVYKKGLYGGVRHPVYSGLIISVIGLSLFVYSLIFLVYSFVAVLMLIYLAVYEEKNLIRRFGKKYMEYRKQVPMLIPGLRRGRR
jgi:protein-S-isoprenylcysteine O-methyltransferase Ste14